MGIVNVTPDSFSDGGLFLDPGAGRRARPRPRRGRGGHHRHRRRELPPGVRSRPGRRRSSAASCPSSRGSARGRAACSRSTRRKAEVAEAALDAGADIINDISSFRLDPRLLVLAARHGAGFILMHMQGVPKTMQVQSPLRRRRGRGQGLPGRKNRRRRGLRAAPGIHRRRSGHRLRQAPRGQPRPPRRAPRPGRAGPAGPGRRLAEIVHRQDPRRPARRTASRGRSPPRS